MEPMVQCRIHKGSPIIRILRRINPFPIFLRSILIFSSHLRLGLLKGIFPLGVSDLKARLPSTSDHKCHEDKIGLQNNIFIIPSHVNKSGSLADRSAL